MAYAILRTNKIKSMNGAKAIENHNTRNMDVPHAKTEFTHLNKRIIGSGDIKADIQKRLDETGITKIRKNGVLALEFVLSASGEYFGSDEDDYKPNPEDPRVKEWVKCCGNFIKDEFGEANTVSVDLHVDEFTPHLHVVVLPVVQNHVRATKRRSDRKYEPYKLNCSQWTDGREKLRGLQDRYHEHVKELGLERGVVAKKSDPKRYTERATVSNMMLRKEKESFVKDIMEMAEMEGDLMSKIESNKKEVLHLSSQKTQIIKDLNQIREKSITLHNALKNVDLSSSTKIREANQQLEELRIMKEKVAQKEAQLRKTINKKDNGFSF